MEYFIKESKYKISEFKQADFIREEDKDIFISSKDEIHKIEEELSVKLVLLKKKLEDLTIKEIKDLKEIETLNIKIKKFKNIFIYGKYDKKYIDTEAVIEEDKNEYSKSISIKDIKQIKNSDNFNNQNNEEDFSQIPYNRNIKRNKTHLESYNYLENFNKNNNSKGLDFNINLNYRSHSILENDNESINNESNNISSNNFNSIDDDNNEINENEENISSERNNKRSKYNLYKKFPQINPVNLKIDS